MTRAILTLNAGSSSLKLAVYALVGNDTPLAEGQADAIGQEGVLELSVAGAPVPMPTGRAITHTQALETTISVLSDALGDLEVVGVGHRVVHGGRLFNEPTRVGPSELDQLARLVPFAPLHQPHNLAGIAAATGTFPDAAQVACFDTAFHRTQPFLSETFALPRRYYEAGVRRYGFHGLSYEYVSGELARLDPVAGNGRVVIAHLGNGASLCALQQGVSIASTMGFSVLDGLPMGTRSGQLDPGVVLYMMTSEGLSPEEISEVLYKQSGLLGLSGFSNDMRVLEAAGSAEANSAISYFTRKVREGIGAMAAVLEGLDALVFSGGIGENAPGVRAEICQPMSWLGINLDDEANARNAATISSQGTGVRVMVIPTNEELVIARATRNVLGAKVVGDD